MTQDYQQLLDDLTAKKITDFTVAPDEFMAFQKVWVAYPNRKLIKGHSHRNGEVTYTISESVN